MFIKDRNNNSFSLKDYSIDALTYSIGSSPLYMHLWFPEALLRVFSIARMLTL